MIVNCIPYVLCIPVLIMLCLLFQFVPILNKNAKTLIDNITKHYDEDVEIRS